MIFLGINASDDEGLFNESETHTHTPVTPRHIAQAPYRWPSLDYIINPFTYTPDFVFPTEDPIEVEPSASSKLQESPFIETSFLKMKSEHSK